MRTVEEVRRLRLAMLRERYRSLSDLNEKLGLLRRDSTLSQILNESRSSAGKVKIMGSELARRIEQTLDLEVGWMDTDPAFDIQAPRLSQEALQLAREFDRRPAHEREAMLNIWRTLSQVAQGTAPAPVSESAHSDEPGSSERATEESPLQSRLRKAH